MALFTLPALLFGKVQNSDSRSMLDPILRSFDFDMGLRVKVPRKRYDLSLKGASVVASIRGNLEIQRLVESFGIDGIQKVLIAAKPLHKGSVGEETMNAFHFGRRRPPQYASGIEIVPATVKQVEGARDALLGLRKYITRQQVSQITDGQGIGVH
jgi:hypothetical protein